MRVGVIGTGHVGLVTSATLAAVGHDVIGFDSDAEKIALLARRTVPFHEPGLQQLLTQEMTAGRLRFSGDAADSIGQSDVVFICVGTPPRPSGEPNLVAVEKAAQLVATHFSGRTVVVEKSTVPAGTAQRVRQTLLSTYPGVDGEVEVVSNPEFLREGRAVEDSLNPDRILVGAEAPWAFEWMRDLYRPLIEKGGRMIETDIKTAELAKHACNAFLALKVSYINSVARVCELSGADVVSISEVMGSDPRIGAAFLEAGMGYGGSCFPKDLQAFDALSSRLGYDFSLLREVAHINRQALEATLVKIREGLWNLEDKKIALLGLSFKPGTDDTRSAPALELGERLMKEGARVVGYDPKAMANAKEALPGLELASDAYEAARDAHCVVVCTEWPEFSDLDLVTLKDAMSVPLVVDGRNIFEPDEMRSLGFIYYPTGRPAIT
jgi:UDPglucose 6-dehydrogenase